MWQCYDEGKNTASGLRCNRRRKKLESPDLFLTFASNEPYDLCNSDIAELEVSATIDGVKTPVQLAIIDKSISSHDGQFVMVSLNATLTHKGSSKTYYGKGRLRLSCDQAEAVIGEARLQV